MFQKSLADRLAERREEKGFTLIELLVVMIIIGILAAIAIPLFMNQKDKARETALKNDLRNLATYAESWAVDHNGLYTGFTVDDAVTEGFVRSTSYTPAANGALTATIGTTGTDFCVVGTITNPATTWSYDSNRAAGPQLAEAVC